MGMENETVVPAAVLRVQLRQREPGVAGEPVLRMVREGKFREDLFMRLIGKHREMNAGLLDSDRELTGGGIAPDELEEVVRTSMPVDPCGKFSL